MKKLLQMLLYGGLTKEEYQQTETERIKYNLRKLRFISLVAICFFGITYISVCTSPELDLNQNIHGYGILLSAFIFIASFLVPKAHKEWILVLVLLFMSFLFVVGILLGTVMKDHLSATFIAFLLIVPGLFAVRPIYSICVVIIFAFIGIQYISAVKLPEVAQYDRGNIITFAGIGIILSGYMIQIMFSNFSMKERLLVLAGTDQLTQVKNRNSFQLDIQKLKQKNLNTLACIFVDANGLHELNNTEGHDAGDRMLKQIAALISDSFGTEETYRIGGDEFVAFGLNLTETEFQEKIVHIREGVAERGYQIAVGSSYHGNPDMDFKKIVRLAEGRMYEDKDAYYQVKNKKQSIRVEARK